jgi:hypothetical protein
VDNIIIWFGEKVCLLASEGGAFNFLFDHCFNRYKVGSDTLSLIRLL